MTGSQRGLKLRNWVFAYHCTKCQTPSSTSDLWREYINTNVFLMKKHLISKISRLTFLTPQELKPTLNRLFEI